MLNRAFLIGMLGQVDWTQDSTEALVTSADGRGWVVGPYLAARLTPNLSDSSGHLKFGPYRPVAAWPQWRLTQEAPNVGASVCERACGLLS